MQMIEDINTYPTPFYIVYENRIRRNLDIIDRVRKEADVEIIMAFKANALWKTFDALREYGFGSTASSLNELLLGNEFLRRKVHSYCPVYTSSSIKEFLKGSSHITFNSISQFLVHRDTLKQWNIEHSDKISAGLRVNPQCSVIETDIYNPALPGSRFGVTSDMIGDSLPDGIEGLHFHQLCESTSYDLEKVLEAFKSQFGKYLSQIKWVNMGGGHLMTRKDYDVNHLISLLQSFHNEYPWIRIILEPGSAFMWRTGDLVTTVMDIIENQGIKTAIIDASFACHMPDTLEMPYMPTITESVEVSKELPTYRLGGNSCLSGDFKGDWSFPVPLKQGDRLTFEDMNHYTTVKTNMFNGIQHPDIIYYRKDNSVELLRHFTYDDYKNRMD